MLSPQASEMSLLQLMAIEPLGPERLTERSSERNLFSFERLDTILRPEVERQSQLNESFTSHNKAANRS
jgi:hypothetical protein